MNVMDIFNMTLLESGEEVDQINKKFYGRYNYPWPPLLFQEYPAGVVGKFISQDVGYWRHDRLPANPVIWVAGCGTNQALFTALKFPDAQVYATDISTQSLNVCRKNARKIGVTNLHLEEKSLNEIDYREQFDLIFCTGVVHHNAQPVETLGNISRALKKDGMMEFMVYNYYHRILTTACQKAVRTFYNSKAGPDLEQELMLVKHLISGYTYNNIMGGFLQSHADMHEAEMTDSLIQPVEYSYTVESLGNLLDSCNLQYLLPCLNQFDIKNNALTWNMTFKNEDMRELYEALPDTRRWQITNLLLLNDSPMLWFYLQRKDAGAERKCEQQVCAEFLQTRFRPVTFSLNNYVLDTEGEYQPRGLSAPFPQANTIDDPLVRSVFDAVRPDRTMQEVLKQLNVSLDFQQVNKIRIMLTTLAYPFLLAVN